MKLQIVTILCLSIQVSFGKNTVGDNGIPENLHSRKSRDSDVKNQAGYKKYDFIIVGGGSAGSVIANRLSEVDNWKVLLLEAGEQPIIFTDIPLLSAMFQFTDYNWGYLAEPQENASLGLVGGRMNWPRGKVLGGSSVINYMIHVRGNKNDYDNWEALGNPGWSYKNLLPLFLKSEDMRVRGADAGYHHTGGYLTVEDISFRSKSADAFVTAAQESGYKYVDYNGENQMGVSYIQAATRNGARCSAEKGFLRTASDRPNLTILTRSRVTKILINPKTKKAFGVEYVRNKKYVKVVATKDVILSAGALNSPQLLMLSGIGPQEDLEELNIPVVQNLPVGKKLYDHLAFVGLSFTVNESIVIQQEFLDNPVNSLQYMYNGTGPLSTLGGAEAVAYLKTNTTNFKGNYPNIEFMFIGGGLQTDRGRYFKKMMRITDKIYDKVWKPLEESYAISIWPLLLWPKSYGYIKLRSKNPFHWPKFYGNYLTDPENEDVKDFLYAIREAQRIVKAPALQRYNAQVVKTPLPGCETHTFDSDDYWECVIRHVSCTMYHQTSTCRMGPPQDPEAVVNSRLRVHGVKNLRVADASIFPTTVSAHTNAVAYVVGEKASELIKEDWAAIE